MEDLLYYRDLHGSVEGDTAKPIDMKREDWTILNRKTIGLICQWLDDGVFHHVSTETSAYDLWKKLESLYDRKSATNKVFLFKKLVNLIYKEGKSIAEHLNEMNSIFNQLAPMKIVFDDELQALMLLSSLPETWETLVVTVSNSAPDGVVFMSQVTSSLLNEETRRKFTGSSHSEAFVVNLRGRSRGRSSTPHNRDQSCGSSRGRSPSKQDIGCHYCKKKGHMKRECLKLKFKEENRVKHDDKNQENTTAVSSDGELVVVCDENCVNLVSQDTNWVIDSGASFHVTSRADFFTSYNEGDFGCVRIGNEDVRHVRDIRLNLISTGKLDDEGYNNHFGNGKWKLTKDSLWWLKEQDLLTLQDKRKN
ncbi:hypothetical protein RHSIM_Rhsim10G0143100 [Rhododendron simsii]|uniref:CCHC-type domain-containing protein n=1 Tax=Rhododendron simsii TaxID=118357 RepID=A0A834G9X2_RHOSS|nr:hypothetical protein RHSIM_Rhsim10G0143100 [Rhododendron simsii]